jgi:hypothetical protein
VRVVGGFLTIKSDRQLRSKNRRNKQTYDTYAFTIDIVLLVLQDYYFAGFILEYNGIIVEMRHQRKRNANLTPKYKEDDPSNRPI